MASARRSSTSSRPTKNHRSGTPKKRNPTRPASNEPPAGLKICSPVMTSTAITSFDSRSGAIGRPSIRKMRTHSAAATSGPTRRSGSSDAQPASAMSSRRISASAVRNPIVATSPARGRLRQSVSSTSAKAPANSSRRSPGATAATAPAMAASASRTSVAAVPPAARGGASAARTGPTAPDMTRLPPAHGIAAAADAADEVRDDADHLHPQLGEVDPEPPQLADRVAAHASADDDTVHLPHERDGVGDEAGGGSVYDDEFVARLGPLEHCPHGLGVQ